MYTRRRHRHNLDSVAIGRYAGEESFTENTVSVGRKAGYSVQKQYAIAIGDRAGEEAQDLNAIAIGSQAGKETQSTMAIAVGDQAGRTTQGANAIAIGEQAGKTTQGANAIAIGDQSGVESQSTMAIGIGSQAGKKTQGEGAIAIGKMAGSENQGKSSIAIGSQSGLKDQPEYSIIISTSDTEIVAKKKGLYIDPIRKFDDRELRLEAPRKDTIKEGNILSYNYQNDTENATKEVVTGFPRLPVYPSDAEVLLAFTEAKKDLPPPILGPLDQGTMYFDSTKKKIKVYDGVKWTALADEDDLAKLKAAGAGSAGAALSGKIGFVPGAADSATQSAAAFVTGGGAGQTAWQMGNTSGNPVTVVGPDGQLIAAKPDEFYWDDGRNHGFETGYVPIFYKDINVVTERVPDSAADQPGYYVTTYDNGHVTYEEKPVADWNPPLNAFNNLPADQRREILDNYCAATGVSGMTSPAETHRADAFEGVPFRNFLTSQGVTGT